MYQPRTILHPTDYSACARHAFGVAVDIARQYGARLLILHVADTLGPERVSFGEVSVALQPSGHRHALQEQLRRVQPPAESGVLFDHILGEGDPASVIAEVAALERCDLIVMGTYGRDILSRLLTGSVTQKLSHLTTCPLLTVRLQLPPTPSG